MSAAHGSRRPLQRTSRRTLNFGFDRFSGLYLWALFILVFGIWVPNAFLTTDTLHSVASSQAISAMVALAVLAPLAAGVYDLSVGATANLTAIVVAVLQAHHHSIGTAIAVAIATGVAVGVINGFLVVKLQISSFIATLGMATVLAAVQSIVSGQQQPAPPTASSWLNLTQSTVGGFQVVVVYLVVLAVIFWWVLAHTPAGRYIDAVGANAEAARLSGVSVGKWRWLSLVCSGAISGLAGVLYCSLNGPSLTFGTALLLPAYAAVFLGSTQLKPGRFNVWGTLIAVYVLATGVQGLQFVTGVQWLNDMFNGVALLAAVAFAGWRQRKSLSRRFRRSTGRSDEPDATPTEPDQSPSGAATSQVASR
ncbi:MAG: ABC-type transporter, integral rane subunit [Conexibacter sp.]|jgi:ribose transport system permease protein|nr:ABC-type transporter, integral rane subunit [Conexibacter sp.]